MNFQRIKMLGTAHAAVYAAVMLASACLLYRTAVLKAMIPVPGFLLLDALSVFFIFVISIVGFAAAVYSIGYISHDVQQGMITPRKAILYYVLFDLFLLSMFAVVSVNNLGFLWVAIEMTTLVSAFLVGFYRTKQSIEAAWKYIIICSVGIILALLGTIFVAYAMSLAGAPKSLNWTDLFAVADRLDKNVIRIAFIFILVGYGTKAGLAPMHTWLPDAHSQAVAPISALLSGVLLKTALYAIIRFGLIVNRSLGGPDYFSHLMTGFGLVSLGIAAALILVQKDLKRLLAYSSIEHVGVVCVGLGIGGPVATLGVLLHIFNHAVTKSLMFFCAGDIVGQYHSHNMRMIRGVVQSMPFIGTMFCVGAFALTGFPPFSIFMSELLIIIAGFSKSAFTVTALFLFFLVLAFSAIMYQLCRILFGRAAKDMERRGTPLSVKIACLFLLLFVVILGIAIPWMLKEGIAAANEILKGI
jgi:hydrogenase-4 component F